MLRSGSDRMAGGERQIVSDPNAADGERRAVDQPEIGGTHGGCGDEQTAVGAARRKIQGVHTTSLKRGVVVRSHRHVVAQTRTQNDVVECDRSVISKASLCDHV